MIVSIPTISTLKHANPTSTSLSMLPPISLGAVPNMIANPPSWLTDLPSTIQDMSASPDKLQHFIAITTSAISAAPQHIDKVQKFGEDAFAAAFLIAALQGLVALLEYQNNPGGELMAPPGLTCGIEPPNSDGSTEKLQNNQEKSIQAKIKGSSWFSTLKDIHSQAFVDNANKKKKKENQTKRYTSKCETEKYTTSIEMISRCLVLLYPWVSALISFILERNTHLFHLGFIVTLAQLWDIPNTFFFPAKKQSEMKAFAKTISEAEDPKQHAEEKLPERVVVIGDSLVVGLGTVNVFDKEQDLAAHRSENLDSDDGPGPVFPKVLARTIAKTTKKPVYWRSAGVNGGDTKEIEEHCLGVIKEEVENGHPPDVVVLISGINDLKHFASNPFNSPGPKQFRSRLSDLITKIRELSPNTKVVLPALPTQMFRRKSPLNIFPLVFFVNSVVGFWDSQKKVVSDQFPSSDVMYIGISPQEIYDWYMNDTSEHQSLLREAEIEHTSNCGCDDDVALISADGVHPNARCYALWAESLADKILSPMHSSVDCGTNPFNICDENEKVLVGV